jgi:hypothetical protein
MMNVQAALNQVVGTTTAPSGSLTINGGNAATATTLVTLTVTAAESLGAVTEMSFSNNGVIFSPWEAYATTRLGWDLTDTSTGGTTAQGTKGVSVRFRDGTGAVSSIAADTIVLDQTAPSGITIKAWTSAKRKRGIAAGERTASTQPTFTLQATDALSGVGDYTVLFSTAPGNPAEGGTRLSGVSYTSPVISTPGRYVLSVQVRDQVGNASSVKTFSFVYAPQGWVAVTGAGVRPRVSVYRADGSLVRTFNAFSSRETGGLTVATGDLDNDGNDEIVVGSGPGQAPEVRIYSYLGKLQRRFRVRDAALADGVTVAVGNVRVDKALEIVTGSVRGTAQVKIFSRRGTLLKTFAAFPGNDRTGLAVTIGDFQKKGTNEIVAARLSSSAPTLNFFTGAGRRTKTLNVSRINGTPGLTLGVADIDADGEDDILLGEVGGSSRVHVIHRSGRRLGTFRPYPAAYRGGVVSVGADLDGDGSDEMLTAPINSGSKFVKAVTLQGRTESGVRPVAPASKTPAGGYRLAPVFLTSSL